MENFEINIAGDILEVAYNNDDSFTILKDKERIAVLYTMTNAEGIQVWRSDDNSNETFVQQVGELITEHEM